MKKSRLLKAIEKCLKHLQKKLEESRRKTALEVKKEMREFELVEKLCDKHPKLMSYMVRLSCVSKRTVLRHLQRKTGTKRKIIEDRIKELNKKVIDMRDDKAEKFANKMCKKHPKLDKVIYGLDLVCKRQELRNLEQELFEKEPKYLKKVKSGKVCQAILFESFRPGRSSLYCPNKIYEYAFSTVRKGFGKDIMNEGSRILEELPTKKTKKVHYEMWDGQHLVGLCKRHFELFQRTINKKCFSKLQINIFET